MIRDIGIIDMKESVVMYIFSFASQTILEGRPYTSAGPEKIQGGYGYEQHFGTGSAEPASSDRRF